jgi:hypothetical protein
MLTNRKKKKALPGAEPESMYSQYLPYGHDVTKRVGFFYELFGVITPNSRPLAMAAARVWTPSLT